MMFEFLLSLLVILLSPPPAAPSDCDPIETMRPGVERPTYTRDERQDTYRRVRAECRRLGATAESCTVAVAVAARESSGRAGVRHRLPADAIAAERAWVRYAHLYGWIVVGDGQGNLVARPDRTSADHNPTYGQFDRWATGLGAMGTQPAVHLHRINPMLPPEWLCVPENATRAQLGIWHRAIHAYGAATWVEANAVSAGAVEANRPRARPDMDRKFCERLDRWGVDCHSTPNLGAFTP